MAEKMGDFTKDLLSGLEEAVDCIKGNPNKARTTIYTFADAKAIRTRLGMSQSKFSSSYGIPLNTLQNWEQGRSHPDHTASAYLWAIQKIPQQISKAQMHHRNSMADSTIMAQ
jgi:putative transcriptional regulator